MATEFKNIVWKENNYYVAQCLTVELSSFGNTKEEALKNLEEAIELYLEDSSDNSIHSKTIKPISPEFNN